MEIIKIIKIYIQLSCLYHKTVVQSQWICVLLCTAFYSDKIERDWQGERKTQFDLKELQIILIPQTPLIPFA